MITESVSATCSNDNDYTDPYYTVHLLSQYSEGGSDKQQWNININIPVIY